MFEKISHPVDFSELITKIIDQTIKTHKNNRKIHEVLHAMASTDEAVNSEFIALASDKLVMHMKRVTSGMNPVITVESFSNVCL